MSYLRIILPLLLSSLAAAQTSSNTPARIPVLVELFTSEGCSSCPPVDKALARLQQEQPVAGAEIILLGFHVDYWDHDGWKDRFSSPQFTGRQEHYAQHSKEGVPYTPQVVVDGDTRQYDPSSIQADIRNAANQPKPIALVLRSSSADSFSVQTTGNAKNADLFFALVEDDLRTEVKGGENGGRVLTHPAVVRQFLPLGSLGENASRTIPLNIKPDWRRDHLHAICFAQERKSGKVVGVASIPISSLSAAGK